MVWTGDRDQRALPLAFGPAGPSAAAPPVVVLSIEPTVGAPAADTEVPIVFPGYVLPDDSLEEPAHEGS
jgi:hypothetical protein